MACGQFFFKSFKEHGVKVSCFYHNLQGFYAYRLHYVAYRPEVKDLQLYRCTAQSSTTVDIGLRRGRRCHSHTPARK